jgi:hypothetical protein
LFNLTTADERTLAAAILPSLRRRRRRKGKPVKNAVLAPLFDYSPKKTPISRSADSGESDA